MNEQDETTAGPYEVNTEAGARWLADDIEKDRLRQHGRRVGDLYPEDMGDVPGPNGANVPADYDPRRYGPRARLSDEIRQFLHEGGWSFTWGKTHRGVVHPDEYIDHDELVAALEDNLGFTFDQLRAVYASRAGGPVPNELRQLRDDIDVRMLALSRSGANMDLLRRLLGLPSNALKRAVARAKERE